MNGIFISYRREDSEWAVDLIQDRLARHFGSDAIFTDIDSIPLGVNFKDYIDEQVGKCDIFLAVIGEKWLSVTDDGDRPRLQQPGDFVRLEIESALKREIPVIPLLVGNAAIPPANKLPKSLRELALRNGTPIRPKPTFDSDVGRLIRGIEKNLGIQVKAVEADEVAEQAPPPGTVFRDTLKDGFFGPEMVVIPAGKFTMGSPEDELCRNWNEIPQHEVVFAYPFAIGKYAVTFEEYDRFVEATEREAPADAGWGRGNRPVIDVSWDDAQAYCAWLSEQTGKRYRLPSEAEWEFAARAGTKGPFSFEGLITDKQVNYAATLSYAGSPRGQYRKQTVPVGSLPENPWGLHEVHGNVSEWVEDCWHADYKNAPDDGRAWLGEDGGDCDQRVIRGGSWVDIPDHIRSANRQMSNAEGGTTGVGFRLAQDL